MMNRLKFVFIERFAEVKPVSLKPDTEWLSQMSNLPEAFFDDIRRYGVYTALGNAVEIIRYRNNCFTEKPL